jgi:hypothetical protein
MRLPWNALFWWLIVAVSLADAVQAQRPGLRGPVGAVQRLPFEATGKVHSLARGVIRMVTDDREPWTIELQRSAIVEVYGEGGRELIGERAFVRFNGQIDDQGNVEEELKEVTLFDPSDGYALGVMEEEAQDEAQDDKKESPGAAEPGLSEDAAEVRDGSDEVGHRSPVTTGKSSRSPRAVDRSARRRSRGRRETGSARNRQALTAGHYYVAGQIQQDQDGWITVVAGGAGRIRAKVPDDVKVKIQTSRYDIVRPGDQIRVKGTFFRPGEASASKVRIDMAPRQTPGVGQRKPSVSVKRRGEDRDSPEKDVPQDNPDDVLPSDDASPTDDSPPRRSGPGERP